MGSKQKRQLRYMRQAVVRAARREDAARGRERNASTMLTRASLLNGAANRVLHNELPRYFRLDVGPRYLAEGAPDMVACTLMLDRRTLEQMRDLHDITLCIGAYFADKLDPFHKS